MKSLILFLVVAVSIIVTVKSDPEWKFELLEPQGFRLLMENVDGLVNATVGADIFKEPFGDTPNEDYEGELTKREDGWWMFENRNSSLSPGDRVFFVIVNSIENHDVWDILGDMIMETYEIPANATRIPA